MVAAVVPAWSATRVAPVEALRSATPTSTSIGRVRRTAGVLLLLAGVLGLVGSAVRGDAPVAAALGTLLAFAGLVTAGPLLARGMAGLVDRGPRGGGWRLAARNIARAPQRSAATALALTIGLTVVCGVAVTAASAKASIADAVNGGNRSDLILKPVGAGQRDESRGRGRPAGARRRGHRGRDAVLRCPGRRQLVVRGRHGRRRASPTSSTSGSVSGSIDDFGEGGMLLGVRQAEALGLVAGDDITVTFPETGDVTLTVAGTFERDAIVGSAYVVSLDDFAANVTSRLDEAILVTTAGDVGVSETKEAVTAALADYPNVKVSDPAGLTADAQAQVDQLLGIVTALLLLAVVVAILGIVNTLVLSVVERTRELGLMRAVGATRQQVRSVVRRESVLMSLLGAVTGIALGTGAGVALTRALVEEGISELRGPHGHARGLPRRGRPGGGARRDRAGPPGEPRGRAPRDHRRVSGWRPVRPAATRSGRARGRPARGRPR